MAGQPGGVLDILKKKMAIAKAEAEKYQEESEEVKAKLADETKKCEESEEEAKSLKRRMVLLEDNLRY